MTFLQVLAAHNIRFKQQAGDPNELTFEKCPQCGKAWKFGLNLRLNASNCYSCGLRSRSKGRQQVLWLLQLRVTLEDDPQLYAVQQAAKPEELVFPKDFKFCADLDPKEETYGDALKYLRRRGISREEMDEYAMGCALTGKYAYRVIIPVFYRESVVGIEARDWTGCQKVKYLRNTGEKSLFNVPPCKNPKRRLVLAEGAFKAIAVRRLRPGTATFGHSITPLQVRQLREQGWAKLLILPDPDVAGVRGSLKAMDYLREEGFDVKFVYPLPRAQADDMSREELDAALRNTSKLELSDRLKLSLDMLK